MISMIHEAAMLLPTGISANTKKYQKRKIKDKVIKILTIRIVLIMISNDFH